MGKRIVSQARGKGSGTYRVRRKTFRYRLKYPKTLNGEGEVISIIDSGAHTAPLARIKYSAGVFYNPAFKGMVEKQKIQFGKEVKLGNIISLKEVPVKTQVYNIESRPGDGGRFIKTAGGFAIVNRIVSGGVSLLLPSKKEKIFNGDCRATVGVIAGAGRLEKPMVKAGRMFHLKKSKGKLWPRTSAIKMNAIDHPFGSGRGKNPKSKIAKRNAPPGARVGHLRPKRTGKKR